MYYPLRRLENWFDVEAYLFIYLFTYLLRHIYTGWTLFAVRPAIFHMRFVVILIYENKQSKLYTLFGLSAAIDTHPNKKTVFHVTWC